MSNRSGYFTEPRRARVEMGEGDRLYRDRLARSSHSGLLKTTKFHVKQEGNPAFRKSFT
jgi:hypothetical protein